MASSTRPGGVNCRWSARPSECPPTLKEGADRTKKPKQTKTAGRTRKAPKAATRRGTRDRRLPARGGVLSRTFKGKECRVTVLDAGFRFDGKDWRSLTAIALHVTGYPAISGPAWFGIAGRGTGATGRGTKRDAGTAAAATA